MSVIETVDIVDRSLELRFEDGNLIEFEDCWLRDHCRCTSCYHADKFQRAMHILDIPDVRIANVKHNKTKCFVKWSDNHESVYESDFLVQFDYRTWTESRRLKPVLWSGGEVSNKIARVHVKKFLNSTESARTVFQSLVDYGVALIEEVDVSVEATETVCKALGGVQHTLFGGMWEFTTKPEHADTAYTNLPLATHNDNTYFTEAAGLQILHCLEHSNGNGGETILVDGFYGATRLKEEFPDDYNILTTFDVEAEYLEDGHHHRYSAPVIQIDKMGGFKQIRFNVYDRSPMAFGSKKDCKAYYRSLRNLATYYEDVKHQWQFKLKPGVVMVMDNFRVLHGRTSFSGHRVLCGSYVSRSDWLDKARVLRVIH